MTLQNQASAAAAAAALGRDGTEAVAAPPDSGGAASDDRVIEFPAAGLTANRSTLDVSPVVKVEQVRLLYQHPGLILVNLVNAALVVAVLWQVFPHRALLIWFALFLIVIPVRLIVARLQARQRWPASRAAAAAIIGSTITGALWGLLAFAIIAIPDIAYQVFIVFVLGGMTAGAILLDATYLPAFFAFLVPSVAPAVLAFLLGDDRMSMAMGIMLAAFVGVQIVVGHRANRWIIDTLRLQAQRENLTADLYRTTAELSRREAILRIMANHDQLTGLFNRYYLFETLGRETRRARRLHLPITVAMLDIDHFKDYNDNFGHEAGDEVLRALGGLLQGAVRGSDIVCRYGGEEFLLVFLDSGCAAALPRLTQICRDVKQQQYVCQGQTLPSVTLSVGLAEFPLHARTVDGLIRAADQALYAAKKAGRDRIEVLA
jgi:diguanylate cyclase (GGDEF)-like protein